MTGDLLSCALVCSITLCSHFIQDLPFGGVKISGFGKFNGKEGIRDFCYQVISPVLRSYSSLRKLA